MDINTQYIELAQKDFDFIVKSFNDQKFAYNAGFSKEANHYLERLILTDILLEKFEGGPKVESVLKCYQIKDISVKHKKPFLPVVTRKKPVTEVCIKAVVDYYWLVDGEESSVPGQVEKGGIRKNTELSFYLRYREIDGQVIMVNYWDDNGADFGELSNWVGVTDLVEKYKENPSIIDE